MVTPSLPESWQPPAGYSEVESRLPGIKVYAPIPGKPVAQGPETFSCPRCGAVTAYDPRAASVTCSHCGYVETTQANTPGEQAAQSEFTLNVLEEPVRGWGEERREIHCQSCGADLSISTTDLITTCSFCGSNQVISRADTQGGLRPNFLIPFKIDPQSTDREIRDWLGKGWMFPAGLINAGASLLLRGIYLPFWTFSTTIASTWEAQVGYERTERYYDSGSKSWQTRTVIDWRWENGQVSVPIRDMLEPGCQNVSPVLLWKVYPFDLSALTDYDPSFLAGWQAKNYDIPLQTAWDSAKTRMREMAKKACYEDIPTHHVRSFSMNADFDDESWRLILVPVFLTAYQYQNSTYQVIVNGQSGVVAGQKPVAWWKVWMVILALLLPGVISSLIGLPLLALGGVGAILVIMGAILFVGGLIVSGVIVRNAIQAGER